MTKNPKKPRVIWVNEYSDGSEKTFTSKVAATYQAVLAKTYANLLRVRTVKFIEVVPKPRKRKLTP